MAPRSRLEEVFFCKFGFPLRENLELPKPVFVVVVAVVVSVVMVVVFCCHCCCCDNCGGVLIVGVAVASVVA